jgi:hypothetical protein
MNEINLDICTEINRLHQLATKSANEAVEQAKKCLGKSEQVG